MNMREFDKWISSKEGKKVNLPIAQISETRKWVLIGLATKFNNGEVLQLLHKYKKRKNNVLA